ncbi:hypothetical protein MIR68_007671 [Amoeboaphelidium protococcarum]|nr:hypothetical protein MIR68_007671 [Amoeboaphelidium protococcarum]
MQKLLIASAVVFGLISAQNPGNQSDAELVDRFCDDKPVGLYCSPVSIFQKIECPRKTIFTCPKAPFEFCQERGIKRTSGYRAGIARCVPNVGNASIVAYCANKPPGSYCFGDRLNNVRIECPLGLLYKCENNPVPNRGKKCEQLTPTVAVCSFNNSTGGGGSGSGTTLCPPVYITVIRSSTTYSTGSTSINTGTLFPITSPAASPTATSSSATETSSSTSTGDYSLSTIVRTTVATETQTGVTTLYPSDSLSLITSTLATTLVDTTVFFSTITTGVEETVVAGANDDGVVSVTYVVPTDTPISSIATQ